MSNLYNGLTTQVQSPRFIRVSKETIGELHFPKSDVLFRESDKLQREKDLTKAIHLGNMFHSKVLISFEDIEGLKQVETTVWGITDCQVILKKNLTIPTNRIVSIQY